MCEPSAQIPTDCGDCGPSWGDLVKCQALCNANPTCAYITYVEGFLARSGKDAEAKQVEREEDAAQELAGCRLFSSCANATGAIGGTTVFKRESASVPPRLCNSVKELGNFETRSQLSRGSLVRVDVDGAPYVFYNRQTDVPVYIQKYETIVGGHFWLGSGNQVNKDFKMFSTADDARRDQNAWSFCENRAGMTEGFVSACPGVGFECARAGFLCPTVRSASISGPYGRTMACVVNGTNGLSITTCPCFAVSPFPALWPDTQTQCLPSVLKSPRPSSPPPGQVAGGSYHVAMFIDNTARFSLVPDYLTIFGTNEDMYLVRKGTPCLTSFSALAWAVWR